MKPRVGQGDADPGDRQRSDFGGSAKTPWTRAHRGRLIAGVCAGFARRQDVSPWLVRGFGLGALVITFGLAAIVYVVLAVVLPGDPRQDVPGKPPAADGGTRGS